MSRRLSKLQLDILFVLSSSIALICYSYLFYAYLSPFFTYRKLSDHAFYGSELEEFSFWQILVSPELGRSFVEQVALCAMPAIMALYFVRRSRALVIFWTLALIAWSADTFYSGPFGVDGRNGCEQCDFGGLLTIIVAWMSLLCAGLIRAINLQLASDRRNLT